MTQAQLAYAVTGAMRSATVSDWETGKTAPGLGNLAGLAHTLEVPADYLLGDGPVHPVPRASSAGPAPNVTPSQDQLAEILAILRRLESGEGE